MSKLRFIQGVGPFTLVIGLAVTARAAAPTGTDSAAQTSDVEPVQVITIEVDVADLPESRAKIAQIVDAELQRLLSAEAELPAGVVLLDDRRLFVELRPGPIPGADDILIRIEAQHGGAMLAETATENCLSCSDEQVAQKALPMLRPLLDRFPAPPRAVTPADDGDVIIEDATPVERKPARGLSIAGGSLLGVGVVGLGVGIGLIVSNERVTSEPGAAQIDLIQYRPAGIALAVTGGVAAVTGAVLLGLALRGRTRGSVAAGPIVTPGSYGVALSGRF
jgi:hypothetical protein